MLLTMELHHDLALASCSVKNVFIIVTMRLTRTWKAQDSYNYKPSVSLKPMETIKTRHTSLEQWPANNTEQNTDYC